MSAVRKQIVKKFFVLWSQKTVWNSKIRCVSRWNSTGFLGSCWPHHSVWSNNRVLRRNPFGRRRIVRTNSLLSFLSVLASHDGYRPELVLNRVIYSDDHLAFESIESYRPFDNDRPINASFRYANSNFGLTFQFEFGQFVYLERGAADQKFAVETLLAHERLRNFDCFRESSPALRRLISLCSGLIRMRELDEDESKEIKQFQRESEGKRWKTREPFFRSMSTMIKLWSSNSNLISILGHVWLLINWCSNQNALNRFLFCWQCPAKSLHSPMNAANWRPTQPNSTQNQAISRLFCGQF